MSKWHTEVLHDKTQHIPSAGMLGEWFVNVYTDKAGGDIWGSNLCIGTAMQAFDDAIRDVYDEMGTPTDYHSFIKCLRRIWTMGNRYMWIDGGNFCGNTMAGDYAKETLQTIAWKVRNGETIDV